MKMSHAEKLIAIKIAHTLIWCFFVSAIFYITYSGISNNVDIFTWIAIGLVVGEGIVLTIFNMYCPLTIMARRYSDSTMDNFDIYLPNWLARHNKLIFTTTYVISVIIVLVRVGFHI